MLLYRRLMYEAMDVESLRDFCLALPEVTECMPFDDTTLVFKVGGKMFLFAGLESVPLRFNVKCDPDLALVLRDTYPEVVPGYHCNKKYWNTITLHPGLKERLVKEWIGHSSTPGGKKMSPEERENLEKLQAEWNELNGLSRYLKISRRPRVFWMRLRETPPSQKGV